MDVFLTVFFVSFYVLAGCSEDPSSRPRVVVAFKFLFGLRLRVALMIDRSSVLKVNGDEDEFGPSEYSDMSPAPPREDTEPRKSRSLRSTRRRELVLIAEPLEMNGTFGRR
jgi:hypothetical protein